MLVISIMTKYTRPCNERVLLKPMTFRLSQSERVGGSPMSNQYPR